MSSLGSSAGVAQDPKHPHHHPLPSLTFLSEDEEKRFQTKGNPRRNGHWKSGEQYC